MASEQPSDDLLLRRIAQRDASALETLYERHAQVVFNLIVRIVRDPATADEVLQDTFWQAWQKAGDFRADGAVAAWLYRIARNKSLDWLRREQARPQLATQLPEETLASMAAPQPSVEQEAARSWQRQYLQGALAAIPSEQRRCVELAYFEGMSQQQIANYLQTPVGTVKTRLRLAVEKLARMVHAAGLQAEDIEP
ncbi:MAG: sigma-70 family RNA polymerase sigma factor [Chloroflexales bacterium]|nr:sigma-70 family RNA polymerase sigma factor [Chloroflexales bacterium]